MDRLTMMMEPTNHRLRRVGRLARRRMRIEGAELRNGTHTDGRLTVTISGLGLAAAGAPETFEWSADRPIALVIVRSGLDGDDVSFQVGPLRAGHGRGAQVSDGAGIRYIAFCYDAEPDPVAVPVAAPAAPAAVVPPMAPAPVSRRIAAAVRGDRSILAGLLWTGAPA